MKKMAVICTLYGYAGGTARVTTEIVERYARDGNTVDVFCAKYDDTRMENSRVHSVTVLPVTSVGLFAHAQLLLKASRVVKRGAYDIIYTADALHIHPDIVTVHIMKRCSRKTVEALEKSGRVARVDSPLKRLLRRVYMPLIYEMPETLIYRRHNTIYVCVSDGMRHAFERSFRAPFVRSIPNGVDANLMRRDEAARARLRAEYALAEGDRAFLFVGSDWRRKRLDMAIRAVSVVPGARLFVLGLDDTRPRYQALAKECGCAERVEFVGFSKEVQKYFSMADYLLFPTTFETFGLVALEGMAASLVVFSSRVNGTEDYIQDGVNGFLFEPGDQAALDEKIAWMLAHPEKEAALRKAAVETAERMTWDAVYERYRKVFDEYARKA